MNAETLSLTDFIKDVLPCELHSRAKGRPIQIKMSILLLANWVTYLL